MVYHLESKDKSLMFSHITHTTNPIAGRHSTLLHCENDCQYCYARSMKQHFTTGKYLGDFRLEMKALKKFPDGSTVFLQDMSDIGDSKIPRDVIYSIINYILKYPKVTYLLLTKCPQFYSIYHKELQYVKNVVFGVTIETNRDINPKISKATTPTNRLRQMISAMSLYEHPAILVSVEPIMEFDYAIFLTMLLSLKQIASEVTVAIGYDNHNSNLPEPELSKVTQLIETLSQSRVGIVRKTLREPIRAFFDKNQLIDSPRFDIEKMRETK